MDFYITSSKKLISFNLENMEILENDRSEGKPPEKLSLDFDFDFNDIEELISKKMEEEKINNKIQKLLFSLQNVEGRNVIIATVFISSLGLISALVDLENMEIKDFKKRSFFDMMKIVS